MENNSKIIKILLITCFILILSNFFTFFSLRNKVNYLKDNLPVNTSYPLLDFSRNFKEQKDFLVNLRALRTDLTNLVNQTEDFDISIYIEFLNTGANISINPDLRIFPASLTKIPVAMTLMKKIESTELNLNDELLVTNEDLDSGWGNLYKDSLGKKMTIESLIKASLQESDNTAHNVLYRNITPEDVSILEEELGLSYFFDQQGKVTSREYTRIFRALYTSSFLKKENSQYLLELLTHTSFKEFLNQGLSNNIVFAHKFGEKKSDGIFLDAGIVYEPNRPYLITVLLDYNKDSNSDSDQEIIKNKGKELMKKISELTYTYLSTKTP